MQFTIFANGKFNHHTIKLYKPTKIIAADGGARHCKNLGIKPDVLIGDLDSIAPDILAFLESGDVDIVRHPENKNETDLELAINYAVEHGAMEITLYGLLGGRWDMSFANIMLLASPQYSMVDFQVIGDNLKLNILRGGKSITLYGKPGDLISVLPLGGNAQGVTYTGLAWPLKGANLYLGSPLGMSNTMLENEATIRLVSGTLLIFHDLQISENDGSGNRCC